MENVRSKWGVFNTLHAATMALSCGLIRYEGKTINNVRMSRLQWLSAKAETWVRFVSGVYSKTLPSTRVTKWEDVK